MFDKILVGIDGSRHADSALKAAHDLALLSGGAVRVVNVGEVASGRGGAATETSDEAKAIVEEAVRKLEADGVEASGTVCWSLSGRVASELLAEAERWGATIIVLSTRGLSDLAGLVVGSTTHKVLHLGNIPVLVVK